MKIKLVLLIILFATNIITAQKTGSTTPNATAGLEIKINTKGLLIPVMNTVVRNAIASPTNG